MPNAKNITKANAKRTPTERRENAQKGGIASGVARRRKKTMRELLEMALSEVVVNKRTGEKKTREEWVVAGLIKKAIQGDVPAFRAIADTLGESAPMKIDANVKQEQSVEISFGDMDVETLAVFLADVKKQAEQRDE